MKCEIIYVDSEDIQELKRIESLSNFKSVLDYAFWQTPSLNEYGCIWEAEKNLVTRVLLKTNRIEWHEELRLISKLRPHPKNPRRLTKEQHAHLRYNLQKFGMAAKPEVNQDGQIIGGHMRIKVWKELGHHEVVCNVPNRLLTPEEVDEACIRFNQNQGEWDWDCLGNEWEVQNLFDWGFTADELHIDSKEDKPTKEKKEKTCPNCGEPI